MDKQLGPERSAWEETDDDKEVDFYRIDYRHW